MPASETPRDTFLALKGLIENHEYEFRVSAANEIGVSEPLVMSKRVMMKLDFSNFIQKL